MVGFQKSKRQKMRVLAVHKLPGDVSQVVLQTADKQLLSFNAGQYLMLHRQNLPDFAYSIASSPIPTTDTLELHIQCYVGSQTSGEIVRFFEENTQVEVTLPLGECYLDQADMPDAPMVFIAASTGFSQIKSMIEFYMTTHHSYPCFFYWGARQPDGFYMPHLPMQWAKAASMEYHPVVSGLQGDGEWGGRFGLLYEAVLEDRAQFTNAHFYIGGSPTMVYATVDALVAAGFSESKMHSDAFDYAPR